MTPHGEAPCGAPLPPSAARAAGELAAGPAGAAAVPVDCPMCGLTFVPEQTVCAGCPLHAGCDLARCPRCAYTFPRTSRLWELLRRLFARRRSHAAAQGAAADAEMMRPAGGVSSTPEAEFTSARPLEEARAAEDAKMKETPS